MNQGTVLEWFRATGDAVSEDDPLAEIEAEKTTDTLYAPFSGTLVEVVVPQGETVPIGTVLAYIEGSE